MATFISLEQAKSDLGVLDSERDADIGDKIEQASDIVLDYVSEAFLPEEEWTEETAPPRVRAATSLIVRSLFFDDAADPLSEGVRRLLHRLRDPSLA